jgi:hypothetical protein
VRISELAESFGYHCVQDSFADQPVASGYTSDLLSDVMANGTGKTLLITIQAHKNAVAVCSMAEIPAVVICNDRPIPDEMLEAAREQEIGVFVTGKDQFTVSGELYTFLSSA